MASVLTEPKYHDIFDINGKSIGPPSISNFPERKRDLSYNDTIHVIDFGDDRDGVRYIVYYNLPYSSNYLELLFFLKVIG